MIVAITSTGNSLESFIDPRFGRCSCFVFYNTETKESVFQPNPFKDNDEGVGVDVVEWIATFSCSKIVSGQFGMKIKFKTLKMLVVFYTVMSILQLSLKLQSVLRLKNL